MSRMNRARLSACFACLAAGMFLGIVPLNSANCQETESGQFEKPFAQINQKSITATISFLASDEMAGRDTPSAELTIATAYVAARFRGAGLKGLGDDGSFFQKTDITTTRVPQTGITVTRSGTAVHQIGLIAAGSEPFSYSGEVTFIDDKTPTDAKFSGPVSFVAPAIKTRREQNNFLGKTARLAKNGATAILVQVDPEHPLVARAAQMAKPRMERPRRRRGAGNVGNEPVPVLLIREMETTGEFSIEVPPLVQSTSEVRNVIGMLPGSDPELAKEAIIFTAHLDHIGVRESDGDTVFNGADDDATGVTAVVTLADAFAAMPTSPKRTVIFMTFWGEEKGLLGSRYYADHPAWPLGKTVANINIEMVGRPEAGAHEKCWVTGWHQSNLGKLMNDASEKVGILIFEHPQYSEMLYRSSDNYSLAQKGVVAHSFSAGSLHDDYHKVTDEWEKLELDHMTRVIQGLFAGSLPIAEGDVTPVKASKGR